MKNKTRIAIFVLLAASLACNLGTPPNKNQGSASSTQPADSAPQAPIFKLPGGTPQARPVGINEGLESLNSYQTILTFKTTGPDPKTSSTYGYETRHSKDKDAYYTNLTGSQVGDNNLGSQGDTNSEMYTIGNDQCQKSGDEWNWTSYKPNEMEMLNLMKNLLSLEPLIDNPSFVAEESVNGIQTNHFSFKISGLGVKSGANVTLNQGDYWLAVDGQYIVKYSLITETVVDPNTNVLHMEIIYEVKDINQPFSIDFPQECIDASKITPTPPAQSNLLPSDAETAVRTMRQLPAQPE